MKAHVYWMQGWRNAPPRAVRNAKAWMDSGIELVRWDDTNEHALLPTGYRWHQKVPPAMRCDIVLALAQERFGGLALGADMSPIRPEMIGLHAASLPKGVGFAVWQHRQRRPYNGGSWFPARNRWIALVAEAHRRTLREIEDGPHPKRSPLVVTGPEKWNDLLLARPEVWEASVDVLPGSEVFLFEPRHPDIRSEVAWLDAGFTGDWNGTKEDSWK